MRRGKIVLDFVSGLALVSLVAGCANKLATIERPKGEIELRKPPEPKAPPIPIALDPMTASASKAGINVTVRYASLGELENFFARKEIFGEFAGKNPYPPHTLIFYVKVANRSGKKIKVNPSDFALIDNLNIQFSELSPDDISALYEAKANVWSFAKSTGDLAPGPYGVPLKVVGGAGGGGVRKFHYLIKQVRLAGGVVHPGIAYDGYVAFPRPHPNATSVRLVIGNLKTDFDPADVPASTHDFEFPFTLQYEKR